MYCLLINEEDECWGLRVRGEGPQCEPHRASYQLLGLEKSLNLPEAAAKC